MGGSKRDITQPEQLLSVTNRELITLRIRCRNMRRRHEAKAQGKTRCETRCETHAWASRPSRKTTEPSERRAPDTAPDSPHPTRRTRLTAPGTRRAPRRTATAHRPRDE